jgi:hypothetical protein
MPALYLEELDEEQPAAKWRTVTIEPWSGDLDLKLRPGTKPVMDLVQHRAKQNPLYRRHTVLIDGKKVTVDGDENLAWKHELLLAVVDGIRGVDGKPRLEEIPMDDETKLKLINFPILVNWIFSETQNMAGIKIEEEEKN